MIGSPRSGYLVVDGTAVFSTLHSPSPERDRGHAVLLCPPFAWEEVCAYRCLRAWGADLASAGYGALRLTYPSTGDSGGDVTDPDRLGAWVRAVAAGAGELRAVSGAVHVTAIGMGLGGMLAVLAVAGGAPIDDLALWAVPARGRALVRQLRAFSRLERETFFEGLSTPEPLPPDELEAGGFRLSAETVRALSAVDLTALELPPPAAGERRVLVLDRDGIALDEKLAEHLRGAAKVSVAAGDGYAAMTSHPETAVPALRVFADVRTWLDAAPLEVKTPKPARSSVTEPDQHRVGDAGAVIATASGPVREHALVIPWRDGELSAVLVEPATRRPGGVAVVLLNGGAVRRIGPNRMWVEAGRRWASRGVPVLRLDVVGIGDSSGDTTPYADGGVLYEPDLVPQVLGALDHLDAAGVAATFVLGGLCAGAYWAFHAALQDDRVVGTLMVNPRVLIWDRQLGPSRDLRALVNQPFSLARVRRVASAERVRAIAIWLLGAPWRRLRRQMPSARSVPTTQAAIDSVLERFLDRRTHTLILFSAREPLEAELAGTTRLARLQAAGVCLERIAVRDHTLRPVWAQARAHEALDRALERAFEPVLSARRDESEQRSLPPGRAQPQGTPAPRRS